MPLVLDVDKHRLSAATCGALDERRCVQSLRVLRESGRWFASHVVQPGWTRIADCGDCSGMYRRISLAGIWLNGAKLKSEMARTYKGWMRLHNHLGSAPFGMI
jgi:hypothetical protein